MATNPKKTERRVLGVVLEDDELVRLLNGERLVVDGLTIPVGASVVTVERDHYNLSTVAILEHPDFPPKVGAIRLYRVAADGAVD